jgi:Tfp pilus assembly protein PilN
MRPVNLLPAKNRPHQVDGSKSGSAYIIVAVMGLLLAGVVAYVLQTNKISQARTDTSVAEQKTAEARAKAVQNGPYANFAQVKQQRVDSVKQLADGRFDWERTLRELALVLPDGVWVQNFDAATTGATDGTSTSTGATANPTMRLHGCALKQPMVAKTLLHLKRLEGVSDVTLSDSTRGADPAKGATATNSGSAVGGSGCGVHNGHANYDFNAVVEFTAPAAPTTPATTKAKPTEIPVRLGGGS